MHNFHETDYELSGTLIENKLYLLILVKLSIIGIQLHFEANPTMNQVESSLLFTCTHSCISIHSKCQLMLCTGKSRMCRYLCR